MSANSDAAESMIRNLEQKTGKSFDAWLELAREAKVEKTRELIKHLKTEHGLTHGYANLIAMSVSKSANTATATQDELLTQQYAGAKADLRPLYNTIVAKVKAFGDDVELAPKKAYVSLRRKKQFALVQPSTAKRLDIGINLKGVESTNRLETSGSFNSMVSHRVRITDEAQIDDELVSWLEQAYEAAG